MNTIEDFLNKKPRNELYDLETFQDWLEKSKFVDQPFIDKHLIKNAECFEKKISKFGQAIKPKYTLTHPFAKQEA